MIKTRSLKQDEKTFGKLERGLIYSRTLLKELNPIKTDRKDLKVMKELYGQVPLVEVEHEGEIIGVVKWNNSLNTLYDGELIVESEGITQLADGKFVKIEYTAGRFDAYTISKEVAHKLFRDISIGGFVLTRKRNISN